jgi:squalene-hopene/tetraprenyl-beta-curcumene cyclase
VGALSVCLVAGSGASYWHAASRAAGNETAATANHNPTDTQVANTWDAKAAAAYLDGRIGWWMGWPKAARDHETFCVSCHTALPYALSRPALGKAVAEEAPSANERRLLENVVKRVRLWKEVAPYYSDADRGAYKTSESRGTESVLNALVLASRDAQGGRLSDDTRAALQNMWAEQQTTGKQEGAWPWLRFANEPWEADDSDYFGATLAAVAVGTAPEGYRARPEIRDNVKMLREYLNRECAAQTAINRVDLLWASAKTPGLIDAERRSAIIQEVLVKQQADGGWSLSALTGGWKRADGTAQEAKSDGYATGAVVFALQQAAIPRENAQLQRGLRWLANNQNKSEGFWPGYSLNKNEAHHLSAETARFMTDAATAYAVLALSEASRPN